MSAKKQIPGQEIATEEESKEVISMTFDETLAVLNNPRRRNRRELGQALEKCFSKNYRNRIKIGRKVYEAFSEVKEKILAILDRHLVWHNEMTRSQKEDDWKVIIAEIEALKPQ